ncbi:flagellin N-terminal helical domain-containing protein [Bordetella sp. 2513F-2]
MQIHTNVSALTTQRHLAASQGRLTAAIERLGSGLRINHAADDAAGSAVANRMESQIRGKSVAERNAQDALSLLETLDTGLEAVNEHVQRVRELAVQRGNGTYSQTDLEAIDTEIAQRLDEIDRLAASLSFNGVPLMSTSSTLSIQTGESDGDTVAIMLRELDSKSLGLRETPPPLGPALQEIRVNTSVGGFPPGTYDIGNPIVTLPDGGRLYGKEEVAAYFGISTSEIEVRQVYTAQGQPLGDSIAIRIGDDWYHKSANAFQPRADGTADYQISLSGSFSATVVDQATGTSTAVTLNQPKVGWTKEGVYTPYVEWNGYYFPRSLVSQGRPLVVNGPGANNIELMEPNYLEASDGAMIDLDSYRAYVGAMMNRFESVVNGLADNRVDLEAARSRIRDADYAVEISSLSRARILQQAGQALLAQANTTPELVLTLLRQAA